MEYIAPRNMTVTSKSGRSVEFVKGEPTFAPPQMHAELIAAGVVPAEELPEPDTGDEPQAPVVPDERKAAVFAAFEKILLRNKRNDFAATGAPHLAVITKTLGWEFNDAKERDALWNEFNLDRSPV